ncbi:unnamed protein product [Owenia fusiformis]|uniref:Uncharacterized protein n=1 Tax=Owenia fusiformis TaxID=6347 RepID=A0A8J1XSQ9_OWEFU|nr:unnamed protein product [Owenia fusiformis]
MLYWTLLIVALSSLEAFHIPRYTADQNSLELNNGISSISHTRVRRVIGGKPATDHSFVVALKIKSRRSTKSCTGSLISRCHVLTATHCLSPRKPGGIRMTAGQYNTKDPKDGPVQQLGDWDKGSTLHRDQGDVAIMRLKKCVTVTKTVAPICLADEEVEDDCDVTVYGWGLTNPRKRDSSAKILQEVTTKLSTDECNKKSTSILRCQICTSRVTALGDSGGPIVVKNKDDKKCQIGVSTKSADTLAKPVTKFSLYASTAHPAILDHFIKKFIKENPCPCDSTVKFCKPDKPENGTSSPESTTPASTATNSTTESTATLYDITTAEDTMTAADATTAEAETVNKTSTSGTTTTPCSTLMETSNADFPPTRTNSTVVPTRTNESTTPTYNKNNDITTELIDVETTNIGATGPIE